MDGEESDLFEYFEHLLLKGLIALNKHLEEILVLIKVMSFQSPLPCFKYFDWHQFVDRFKPDYYTSSDCLSKMAAYVRSLVRRSMNSRLTEWYDEYQRFMHDIAY